MADLPEDSFISHLIELRTRLIRSAVAFVAVFACLMPFSSRIYDILAAPLMRTLPAGTHMIATGVVTPFFVPIKVTMMVALIIALPYLLWQAWAFIAPGLYAHEKRLAAPLVVASSLLFLVGMAFCYYFVFGVVFKFIAEVKPESVTVAPDIEQYLAFVMSMFLAFGLTFEVPIVVIVLVKMGLVSIEKLREIRPYVIVGAFVVAAVLTPPDVTSQIMLAVPMCLLYEAGILVARMITRPTDTHAIQARD
ncbi:twin-arginine translocase subunit TatC [Niveibacterium umoris]|uniref:Sec-independent protein translocase protein TatC n=1 Tax=Niveibacterium umoris TaxID=1193620 RepID=A0A840BQP1_9RHOO|nr:twin-arginine translocase subunit TatC [Niveibacterium umoris]MBB4012727.1 sec-independent protein translocase protein TatC [Niveibacterium umoris]